MDLELKPLRFLHSILLILTNCPFLIGGSENSFKYLGFHWLTRRSECLKCAKYFRSSRTSYSHHRSNRQYYVCNNDVLQCYYIYQMVVVSMISIYTEKNSKSFAAKIFKISKSFAATLGWSSTRLPPSPKKHRLPSWHNTAYCQHWEHCHHLHHFHRHLASGLNERVIILLMMGCFH